MKGKHWLLRDDPQCKQELATQQGTALCALMSYAVVADAGDQCIYYPAETCHARVGGEGTEVVLAVNYWTSDQLGVTWAECSPELRATLDDAPLCVPP